LFWTLKKDLISKINKLNMMNMKSTLILLCFLASIVILSGCVGQGGGAVTAGTDGLIIKEFGFDYSPIYSGESTGLTLTLQNVGGEKGTLKEIEVFGVDAPAAAAGTLTWGYGTVDDFKLEEGIELVPVPVELLPPDPTTGFEGEEFFQEWVPQSPTSIRSPTTYDFQTRVKYLYTTVFTGKITVVDDAYLRSLPADQREALIKVGGVQDASVTGGPLALTAASGRHFILRTGEGGTARSIKFKIANVGSGYPYIEPWSNDNLHKVTVTGEEGIDCNVGTAEADIKLSRGKTGVISCEFTPPVQGTFSNKIDKMFSVTLSYGYYVDSSASITVNPVIE